MAALLQFKPKFDTEQLAKQLDLAPGVLGRARKFVEEYLIDMGFDNLEEVTVPDLLNYRSFVWRMPLSNSQKIYYENLLEQVCFAYHISKYPEFYEQAKNLIKERPVRNKTIGFMLMQGITSFEDIDYGLRRCFEEYLELTVVPDNVRSQVKSLDILKLESIRLKNEENPIWRYQLRYENEPIFLLYHPSYELAMTFYYLRNKEELLFDFSVEASALMKRQVVRMLNHVLETNKNWHDRRERFLLPLKWFYDFCCEEGIEDIELITEKQIEKFRRSIDDKSETHTDIYMQLVDNFRKYLFLEAKETNWKANAWYLERFCLGEERLNPARTVHRLTFGQIENERNRELLKKFIRYLIGVSNKLSIQTIRLNYYEICEFLAYLDERGLDIDEVSQDDVEDYANRIEGKGLQATSYNRKFEAIARFFGYLSSCNEIGLKVEFAHLYKKVLPYHNDRLVGINKQMEILGKLGEFPLELRLMFLNLLCAGLRISEVCTIKANAYFYDGTDAWMRIYQPKMKAEKCIPIPLVLYEAMSGYILGQHFTGDEYVFKRKNGGAYSADTFRKKFREWMKEVGITDYDFRSHDFRHTLATALYDAGVPIEAVRDYLGHKTSDMTRQYVDDMNNKLDKANEQYFSERGSLIGKGRDS